MAVAVEALPIAFATSFHFSPAFKFLETTFVTGGFGFLISSSTS